MQKIQDVCSINIDEWVLTFFGSDVASKKAQGIAVNMDDNEGDGRRCRR